MCINCGHETRPSAIRFLPYPVNRVNIRGRQRTIQVGAANRACKPTGGEVWESSADGVRIEYKRYAGRLSITQLLGKVGKIGQSRVGAWIYLRAWTGAPITSSASRLTALQPYTTSCALATGLGATWAPRLSLRVLWPSVHAWGGGAWPW